MGASTARKPSVIAESFGARRRFGPSRPCPAIEHSSPDPLPLLLLQESLLPPLVSLLQSLLLSS